MKLSTKSFLRSFTVTLVLTGSTRFFSWNFWQEKNRTAEAVGAEAVGTVARVRGRARQRHASRNRWSTPNGSEVVYTRDAIRTDSESGVDIDLLYIDADGVEHTDTLALGPDTFVILDLSQRRRNIEFVAGDISASGENLTVSIQGAMVSLNDGSVNLSRHLGEAASVVLTDGDAVINSGGRETAADTTGILRIQDNGEVTRRQAADGEALAREIRTSLTPGTWYWRVARRDGLESSPIGVFTLGAERLPRPLRPARNEIIPFRSSVPAVSLGWKSSYFADSHRIEIADNIQFSNPAFSRNIDGTGSRLWKTWKRAGGGGASCRSTDPELELLPRTPKSEVSPWRNTADAILSNFSIPRTDHPCHHWM